jgi:acyl dehydratase
VPVKYFEDFHIGQVVKGKQYYEVTKEEVIEFARKWDPFPFHTDERAAKDSIFKGLTAPAVMVIAISSWLWHTVDGKLAMVSGLGWKEVRFLQPVRPDDKLSIKFECVDVRPSESKPYCGIVSTRVTVTNQKGEAVLSLLDSYLVQRRGKKST